MRISWLIVLFPLALGACQSFSTNPPPPASNTVVVPPAVATGCTDGAAPPCP